MNELIVPIQSKIYLIRGKQVMIDRDLADLYQVENRALNQAVKRNSERFPDDFMFQLTKEEHENLISQIFSLISSADPIRKMPYAFMEEGVYMLYSFIEGYLTLICIETI